MGIESSPKQADRASAVTLAGLARKAMVVITLFTRLTVRKLS